MSVSIFERSSKIHIFRDIIAKDAYFFILGNLGMQRHTLHLLGQRT